MPSLCAGERDHIKDELREWAEFAQHTGERSATCAARRFLQAEERAETLKAEAAQRSQRMIQLEVRISELESANADLAMEAKSSARQALELKKAQERLKVLGGAKELATRLEGELIEVRGEKQRLSDKLCVLEADCRQYQEELQSSQENFEKVRAELSKLKRIRECENADQAHHGFDAGDSLNASSFGTTSVHGHAKALEMVDALKLEVAKRCVSIPTDGDSEVNVEMLKARIESQAEEIVRLKAQNGPSADGQWKGDVATRAESTDGAAWQCQISTNPFDRPSQQEELQAATLAMQQVKMELEAANAVLQKVQSEHAELVQEMEIKHEQRLQLADSEISKLQLELKAAKSAAESLRVIPCQDQESHALEDGRERETDEGTGNEGEVVSVQESFAHLQIENADLRLKLEAASALLAGCSEVADQKGDAVRIRGGDEHFSCDGSDIETQFALEAARSRAEDLQRQVQLLQHRIEEAESGREAARKERDELIKHHGLMEQRANKAEKERKQLETVGRFLETVNLELMCKIRELEVAAVNCTETGTGWKRLGDAMDDKKILEGSPPPGGGSVGGLLISSKRSRCAAAKERRSRSPKKKEFGASLGSIVYDGADMSTSHSPHRPVQALQSPSKAERWNCQSLHDFVKSISEGVSAPLDVHVEGTFE